MFKEPKIKTLGEYKNKGYNLIGFHMDCKSFIDQWLDNLIKDLVFAQDSGIDVGDRMVDIAQFIEDIKRKKL